MKAVLKNSMPRGDLFGLLQRNSKTQESRLKHLNGKRAC